MPLNEQEKAALSKTRGRLAAGIKDPEQRRKFIAEQGEVDRRGGKDTDYAELMQKTQGEETKQALGQVLGSYKHGGTVPRTGLYKLHAGEKVIPAEKKTDMCSDEAYPQRPMPLKSNHGEATVRPNAALKAAEKQYGTAGRN